MPMKSGECYKTFLCGDYSFPLGERTYLMGVLNITPDSFSGDGLLQGKNPSETAEASLRIAQNMVNCGADLIDVGGESSRPGALSISEQEEIDRVGGVIKLLSGNLRVPISVDTYKASVAEEALKNGASWVNDITGLTGDPRMAPLIASSGASVAIMHMKGISATMQHMAVYQDLMGEIIEFFQNSIQLARSAGITENRIFLDPGIGFGKTVEHNLEILRLLGRFKKLGYPILVGTSRKSFIGKILNDRPVDRRLWGTAATVALAIANGADMIRVHDIAEMKDVVSIADAVVRDPQRGNID